MEYCTKCGRQLQNGEVCQCQNKKIPWNGGTEQQPTHNSVGGYVNNAIGKKSGLYERGLKIVPECIAANDGEVPIKQYRFAKMKTLLPFENAEGRLQVTNKRVLFRATGFSLLGGKCTLHQEFEINDIAGVEIHKKHVFSIIRLIISLLLTALFGVAGFFLTNWLSSNAYTFACIMTLLMTLVVLGGLCFLTYYLYKINCINKFYLLRQIVLSLIGGSFVRILADVVHDYAMTFSYEYAESNSILNIPLIAFAIFMLIAILINLFLYAFVPDFLAQIKTNGAMPALEIRRNEIPGLLAFLFSGEPKEHSGFAEVSPWYDTDLAIKELGAIIDDLQTMGDAAIEKWQQK